jgi:hypothetical protein
VGLVIRSDGQYQVIASEGGNMDFRRITISRIA